MYTIGHIIVGGIILALVLTIAIYALLAPALLNYYSAKARELLESNTGLLNENTKLRNENTELRLITISLANSDQSLKSKVTIYDQELDIPTGIYDFSDVFNMLTYAHTHSATQKMRLRVEKPSGQYVILDVNA